MMEKVMSARWSNSANPVVTRRPIKPSSCNGIPVPEPSRISLFCLDRPRTSLRRLAIVLDINLPTIFVFMTMPRLVFVIRMLFVMPVESTASSECVGNALVASTSIFVHIVTWPWTNMISLIHSFDSKRQRILK